MLVLQLACFGRQRGRYKPVFIQSRFTVILRERQVIINRGIVRHQWILFHGAVEHRGTRHHVVWSRCVLFLHLACIMMIMHTMISIDWICSEIDTVMQEICIKLTMMVTQLILIALRITIILVLRLLRL